MKLVHWPLMGKLGKAAKYIWYSEEGTGRAVPITVLMYNGPLLCGLNVPFKGLTKRCSDWINDI